MTHPYSGILAGLLGVIVVIFVAGIAHEARAAGVPQRGTVAYCKARAAGVAERACIVRVVWAGTGQARKAVRVAACESGIDPRAVNGEYRGVFQMGAAERRQYGHGRTTEVQARAALRYYRAAGWTPWECA